MSNPGYSLPTNGLNCPIPRTRSSSGRFAISCVEFPPALLVAAVLVAAVVVALALLQPRGEKLVTFADLCQRRNKR